MHLVYSHVPSKLPFFLPFKMGYMTCNGIVHMWLLYIVLYLNPTTKCQGTFCIVIVVLVFGFLYGMKPSASALLTNTCAARLAPIFRCPCNRVDWWGGPCPKLGYWCRYGCCTNVGAVVLDCSIVNWCGDWFSIITEAVALDCIMTLGLKTAS